MSFYYYDPEDHGIYFSAKETAYRTNAHGKDTTNAAGDTFFPVGIHLSRIPVFRWKNKKGIYERASIGPDEGIILNEGYEDLIIELEGEMYNLDLLYFALKACTTAFPDPTYTHTYATSTARTPTVPSFQLLFKLINKTSAESILKLFVGCTIKSWWIEWTAGENPKIHYTIHCAKMITGTALTTPGYPVQPSGGFYLDKDVSVSTYSKGGNAYNTKVKFLKLMWDDGLMPLIGASDAGIASEALYGPRKIRVTVGEMPKELDCYDDFNDDPTSAQDKDLIYKFERSATDLIQFTFAKLASTLTTNGTWNNYYQRLENEYMLSPEEAGKLLTIVQTDLKSAARFEG